MACDRTQVQAPGRAVRSQADEDVAELDRKLAEIIGRFAVSAIDCSNSPPRAMRRRGR